MREYTLHFHPMNPHRLNLIRYTILALMAITAAYGSWFKDKFTGTKAFVDLDDGNVAISWSGRSTDGLASGFGILTVVKDGEIFARFEGEMLKGKAHGSGTAVSLDSEANLIRYEGDFLEGEMTGDGTLNIGDTISYQGTFVNNVPNGYGTYIAKDGRFYDGNIKDWKPHGNGSSTDAEKNAYVGEFENGLKNGKGIQYFEKGKYEGSFKNGKYHGIGTLIHPSGFTLEGKFEEDLPVGTITISNALGEAWTGTFENGELVEGTLKTIDR